MPLKLATIEMGALLSLKQFSILITKKNTTENVSTFDTDFYKW